ncbi:MAG: protein kinase [Acidobacteria bacterium]|nr:protein kinase [Acidobacteriota bacterium]
MIGQTVSHYRILDKLGEGGMGAVYLAEDTLLGRRVAVKFLTITRDAEKFRRRFLREARSASALSHPSIATVHDYGETPGGEPFIVMEFVPGRTLAELLREGAERQPAAGWAGCRSVAGRDARHQAHGIQVR